MKSDTKDQIDFSICRALPAELGVQGFNYDRLIRGVLADCQHAGLRVSRRTVQARVSQVLWGSGGVAIIESDGAD